MPPMNVTVAGIKDHDQPVGAFKLVSVISKMVAVVPAVALALKPAIGGYTTGVILK